ncbi:tol-pal system YbgF family protein [Streptomyces sp. BBFR51]|uniref:tol-pal system YbgF family protein n=1 Tax=Streptomyces sp. BBFR51 TaxID=3372856 RepID=UPI0037DC7C1C
MTRPPDGEPEYPKYPEHPEHPEYPEAEYPGPDWPPPVPREPRDPDPLAVAVGNASLLGAGYLIMGRRGLFWVAAAVTASLLWLTYTTAGTWCELLVVLWWAAVVAHGWWLARRNPAAGPRRGQRVLALALALPVLVSAGWLRFDAHEIEDAVAGARERGDCADAAAAQDGVGFRHRLTAAPVVARGDTVIEACERLDTAAGELNVGLNGDLDSLESGFGRLGAVLGESGNERTVAATLDRFLAGLPTDDGCLTVRIADWLRDRETGPKALTAPAFATSARIAPGALMECGDALMTDEEWANARDRYQRLLDEHPDDGHADKARKGIRKADLAIQLGRVRELVAAADGMSTGYCEKPAKYSAAPAYRKGKSRAVFVGDTEYTDKLPEGWRADTPDAALVVCTGGTEAGDVVETCQYQDHRGNIGSVRFNKLAVPVKAYALRTGKLVIDRKVQMGGESCPGLLRYFDELPSRMAVTPSKADVRDAFGPVVGR